MLTNQVTAFAVDSYANKWIGTYGANGSVNKFSSNWQTWNSAYSGSIYALAVDSHNITWAGIAGHGLGEWYNGQWVAWYGPNNSLYVLSVAFDKFNNEWIGTNNGVAKFDGNTWSAWTTANGLPSNNVYSIATTADSIVWAGTDNGLAMFDGHNWITYNTSGHLASNFIWSLAIDSSKDLWIGTQGGLSECINYKINYWNTNIYLPNNFVRAVTVDGSGNVWAGIYGGGVQKFNGSTWTSYTTSNSGLPSNNINAIAIDAYNNKWIATDGGGLAVYQAGGVNKTVPAPPPVLDRNLIMNGESNYIGSCVLPSGGIMMARWWLNTFHGVPSYKISPYCSNFAAIGLLDNPTTTNLARVKNWMTWVFNHLNSDGTIYDYYVDTSYGGGGTEYPSIAKWSTDPPLSDSDYNAKDSYASTFLTLALKYLQTVPGDLAWLQGYASKLRLMGNALCSVIDDSSHTWGPVNYDGLTIGKDDWTVKYTMDNSETNQGLWSMWWLEVYVLGNNSDSINYYGKRLNNNTTGIANELWDSNASMYYMWEGQTSPSWDTLWADAVCQLWPIVCNVISPTSSRAVSLYNTFNVHFPSWQAGFQYPKYPFSAAFGFTAALEGDTSRAGSYLLNLQKLLNSNKYPAAWYVMEAGFAIRAAYAYGGGTNASINQVTKGIQVFEASEPKSFTLEQNYPNPFNPSTEIQYSIPKSGIVTLKVYNLLGQEVMTLVNQQQIAGIYNVNFNASNLPSGIYMFRLQSGNFTMTKKMTLLK